MISGENLITHEKLSFLERVIGGVSLILIIAIAKGVKKLIKGGINSLLGRAGKSTITDIGEEVTEAVIKDEVRGLEKNIASEVAEDVVRETVEEIGEVEGREVVENVIKEVNESGTYSVEIMGGTYDRLETLLEKYDLSEVEYLNLSRTPQHNLSPQNRKLVYKIRMELTADVTDASGVVLPGTRVSKSIDKDTFDNFYSQGEKATLSGCVALQRDTDALGDASDIINSTGLKFEGSKFVDEAGKPNVFYIVDGELMEAQPDLVVRVSATTDGIEISEKVVQQFYEKYPDYKYNGYSITDVSSSNDTYLNEIWTRHSQSQVEELSSLTGISEENIVTEQAKWYNRTTNPDTGTGITLNQGSSNAMGIPEFYAGKGRIGIANGHIYRVEDNIRKLVGVIDEDGYIELIGK